MNRRERRAKGNAGPSVDPAQLSRWFAEAVAHHQSGQFKEAILGYRRVLAVHSAIPEAHHNLGLALKSTGKLKDALAAIRLAIELNPAYADAHNSLGNVLTDLGHPKDALAAFNRALELAPGNALIHNNLATVLNELGLKDSALDHANQAIQINPSYAEAHNTTGAILASLKRHEEARDAFERALALDDRHSRAWGNLAESMRQMGDLTQAEAASRQALGLDPAYGMAHTTLGNILRDSHRLSEAAEHYALAVQALPDLPEVHDNLGNALAYLGRSKEAQASCRKALRLDPDFAKAHNNLGMALRDQGRRTEAEASFKRALELEPGMAAATTNLGMALLYRGDFANGWQYFESRWQTGILPPHPSLAPHWNGESLAGKTILFHAEQGLGDTIQFIRYGAILADLGARVIAEVQPPLTELAATVPGIAQVIPSGAVLPPHDYHLSMMSAPRALGTVSLQLIPAAIPYLSVPDARKDRWRARLPQTVKPLIGLVWAGDSRPHDPIANAADRRRSIPLAAFTPLLESAKGRLVSLQMGQPRLQISAISSDLRPFDPMGDVTDFADTAALVDQLDLVIAVDTSVAHLAGALGKPVWILSRYDGCWRWLEKGETTPWYPTARLFRQFEAGNWDQVIAQVIHQVLLWAPSNP